MIAVLIAMIFNLLVAMVTVRFTESITTWRFIFSAIVWIALFKLVDVERKFRQAVNEIPTIK